MRLFHDGDVNVRHERETLSLQGRGDRLPRSWNGSRGRIRYLTIGWTLEQLDAVAASVMSKRVWTSADRVRADVIAVGFDYLTGYRCSAWYRKHVEKAEVVG